MGPVTSPPGAQRGETAGPFGADAPRRRYGRPKPMTRVRSLVAALSATLLISAVAACGSSDDDTPKNVSAKTAALGTLTSGVIKVAVEPYAPYTSVKGGKIVGLDGDILNYAAKKLGLEVKPQVTD